MANVQFPEKLRFLFTPKRYKVAKGGRGGAKSWGFARALLIQGAGRRLRIVCARETQKSIEESVYQLLVDQVKMLGLDWFYSITTKHLIGQNGTTFSFVGLRQASVTDIKSFEGCDICWVEEAHVVSKRSWEILVPTVRKEGSEIWISYNPDLETDETHKRFAVNPPPREMCEVVTINWRDNPWFPDVLRREMEYLKATNEDDYQHVYEGMCKQVVEGAIYREQLIAADKGQRITRVPYDPVRPVDTYWDLGYGDNVSIWFAQSIGFEFRIIDFLSDCLKDLSYYLKELRSKPYLYGTDYLPHDAKAQTLAAAGKSIQQQLEGANRKVSIVPNLSIDDGIAAARSIFSRCWFDSEKCADGLQALRHYCYEYDQDLRTYKRTPLHNWASHPADAFRYLAVAIKEQPKAKPVKPVHLRRIPITAWS